ncbi:hypothetical protein LCGC14_2667150 [marine sediment metagenome]|uniref:Uncharacterized protein n=1 Tax=marine sediment metagenome TaxID=412755 RepID=A0A0F8ZQ57_9ZZZZ
MPGRYVTKRTGQPVPMASRKFKDYDDDALVMAIARGDKSCTQIAREVGLSTQMVWQVSMGNRRPDLQPRIQAASAAFVAESRRLAARAAKAAVARLTKIIATDVTPTAYAQVKAAEGILRYASSGSMAHGATGAPGADPSTGLEAAAVTVHIHCTDGVLVLPNDLFRDSSGEDGPPSHEPSDPRPVRPHLTRREYLRLIAARPAPGSPTPLDTRGDYAVYADICRQRGEDVPEEEQER